MAVWPGIRSIPAGELPLVPLGCIICIDGKPGGGATRGYRLPQDQHFNRIKGESWEPGEERRGWFSVRRHVLTWRGALSFTGTKKQQLGSWRDWEVTFKYSTLAMTGGRREWSVVIVRYDFSEIQLESGLVYQNSEQSPSHTANMECQHSKDKK